VGRLGLSLCGKNLKGTGHYLWGFLHRIVVEKISSDSISNRTRSHVSWREIEKGRIPFGYEFVTNSVLEPLGSVTLGRDASVAAGPWCRLAGSDGPVARPPLRCARPKERAGWAGPVPWLIGFWPNRLRGNSKTPLFLNLFINYKLI
jgi:hypothetical protein